MYMVALQGKYFIRELGIVRKSNPNIWWLFHIRFWRSRTHWLSK